MGIFDDEESRRRYAGTCLMQFIVANCLKWEQQRWSTFEKADDQRDVNK